MVHEGLLSVRFPRVPQPDGVLDHGTPLLVKQSQVHKIVQSKARQWSGTQKMTYPNAHSPIPTWKKYNVWAEQQCNRTELVKPLQLFASRMDFLSEFSFLQAQELASFGALPKPPGVPPNRWPNNLEAELGSTRPGAIPKFTTFLVVNHHWHQRPWAHPKFKTSQPKPQECPKQTGGPSSWP